MKRLRVWLEDSCVGLLEEDDQGRLRFSYDPAWVVEASAVPLSRNLPLRPDSFHGRPVRAFFGGILPEGDPRNRLAEVLGLSTGNIFSFLEF